MCEHIHETDNNYSVACDLYLLQNIHSFQYSGQFWFEWSPLVPFLSKSTSLFTNSLGIVPSALITTGTTVIFMFHIFAFTSFARSTYLSLFLLSFNFTLICRDGNIHYSAGSRYFFLTITWSGRLVNYLYLKIPENFVCLISHQIKRLVFYLSPSDGKFLEVSRTLLSILANLNCAVVWVFSNFSSISTSPSPFFRLVGTATRAPETNSITVTQITRRFFSFFYPNRLSNEESD